MGGIVKDEEGITIICHFYSEGAFDIGVASNIEMPVTRRGNDYVKPLPS